MTAARSKKIGRKRDGTAYECMKYILPKRIAQGRPLPQQKTSLPFGSEASLSKNPCQIAGQNGSSGIKENKSERRRSFPTPNRQLFQVHGSKLKLDPSCDAGQASVVGITHGVFFFCVGEDPLDRFLAHGI